LVYGIAALLAALDQWIKWQVVSHLAQGQTVGIWPGVLELLYARNPGAAWSMLVHQRAFLIVVAILVCAAIVYVDRRFGRNKPWLKVALGLLMGGAVGNLIDRIVRGYVVDYIYLSFIHFPVFNLADSAVVVGVGMLVARAWFARGDDGSKNMPEADGRNEQRSPEHGGDPR
jgi:signal peptidase II